jgi:diguanylate cyclase (GGDEF)-like protein
MLAIFGSHGSTQFLEFKIASSIITLVLFFISLFNKHFREKYIIYAVYFVMFIVVFNNNRTMMYADEIKPLYLLITGCVMILNTYAFTSMLWLSIYTIFCLINTFVYFYCFYMGDITRAFISTMAVSVFFLFVFMYFKLRSVIDRELKKYMDLIQKNSELEKKWTDKLSEMTAIYEGVYNACPIQMAILDPKTFAYKKVNPKAFPSDTELHNWIIDKDDDQYCKYMGLSHNEVAHKRYKHIIECKQTKQTSSFQETIVFKNGIKSIYERHYTPIMDNSKIKYILMTSKDITKSVIIKNKMRNKLKYDSLTGAYTREYIESHIESNIKANTFFSLAFIDLDNFKTINDTLGHDYGDKLLKMLTTFIKDNLKYKDKVARLGGDEFVVVYDNLTDKDMIYNKLEIIRTKFKEQIARHFNGDYNLSLSIGACRFPMDAKTKFDLLKLSDIAMYISKQNKDEINFYK